MPPLFGFIGKELTYEAKLGFSGAEVVFVGAAGEMYSANLFGSEDGHGGHELVMTNLQIFQITAVLLIGLQAFVHIAVGDGVLDVDLDVAFMLRVLRIPGAKMSDKVALEVDGVTEVWEVLNRIEDFVDQRKLAPKRVGRLLPLRLVLRILLRTERLTARVPCHGKTIDGVILQQTHQHPGKPVHRVGDLAGAGGEVTTGK